MPSFFLSSSHRAPLAKSNDLLRPLARVSLSSGDERAITAVSARLEDEVEYVRKAAVKALVQLEKVTPSEVSPTGPTTFNITLRKVPDGANTLGIDVKREDGKTLLVVGYSDQAGMVSVWRSRCLMLSLIHI